jgi:hypothetical protein
MRREEVRRDCVSCAVRLCGELRRKARELQVRKNQCFERMNAYRAGSCDRNGERCGVEEDEAEAADCNGDSSDALGAQRHEPKLGSNQPG